MSFHFFYSQNTAIPKDRLGPFCDTTGFRVEIQYVNRRNELSVSVLFGCDK